ncbi:hypothetical protein [Megasphaera cerevisiae]|uniref:hypothetical protein n=1 Tax=Megasphaera cerevisiae TaxID=39029 RepID=UPI00117E0849|nr:hypothetical protein [Megasphaera cerevisiae]
MDTAVCGWASTTTGPYPVPVLRRGVHSWRPQTGTGTTQSACMGILHSPTSADTGQPAVYMQHVCRIIQVLHFLHFCKGRIIFSKDILGTESQNDMTQ